MTVVEREIAYLLQRARERHFFYCANVEESTVRVAYTIIQDLFQTLGKRSSLQSRVSEITRDVLRAVLEPLVAVVSAVSRVRKVQVRK